MKTWEELTITDDFLFCKVMSDKSLCTKMIELLLNIKVDHVEKIQSQHQLSPSVKYDDKSNKVFYNLTASELQSEKSPAGNFLRYLISNKTTDDFTRQIESAVSKAKYNSTWRKEYMNFNLWLMKERTEGKKEGIKIGICQTNLSNAITAVKDFNIAPELVAEKYNIPLNDLLKKLK